MAAPSPPSGGLGALPFTDLEALQSIVEHLPAMVFVKEASQLRIVLFNRAGEALIGRPRTELIGRSDFDLFPREQAVHFTAADRAVLTSRQALDIPEEPIDTLHGRRWLHTRKIGLYGPEGAPRFLLGISEDITEKREAVRALDAQRQVLERSSRLSAMGELAGSIAHELNTPLASIALRAGSIARAVESGSVDPAKVLKESRAIEATVERASKIISGLRRFGRSGEGEPTQWSSVSELVADVLELTGVRARALGIAVRSRVPAELRVACRPVQIGQVLVNLLNNACDAVVRAPERWIELEAERRADSVRITVSDSGPPIPTEVRPQLMQPFFTTKALGAGTGLGLSIARRIAQEHGGTLELEETAPHTRFVLTLPATGAGP